MPVTQRRIFNFKRWEKNFLPTKKNRLFVLYLSYYKSLPIQGLISLICARYKPGAQSRTQIIIDFCRQT